MDRFPTGCNSIDRLLGGGVEVWAMTLFYGEAGCGKTNICLQLAHRKCIEGRKVAFVDTEGVSIDRSNQIFKDRSALNNLLLFNVHSFQEQSDRISQIQRMAASGILGMVIVDSLTMFYRLNYDDMNLRNDFVKQTETLLNIAREMEIPVIITSQVYTNISSGSIEFLGGHAMHHNAKTIVRLDLRTSGVRAAVIMKHRSLPEGRTAMFRITADGLSDA